MVISKKVLFLMCALVFCVLPVSGAYAENVVTYSSLDITKGSEMRVSNDYTLRVTPGDVRLTGENIYPAIYLNSNSSLDITEGSFVITDVNGSFGITAQNDNTSVKIGRDVVITSSDYVTGLMVSGANAYLEIGGNLMVDGGTSNHGLYLSGSWWYPDERATLIIRGDVLVLDGSKDEGVSISENADGTIFGDLIVQGGQNNLGLGVSGNTTLTLHGDTVVSGGTGNIGIRVFDHDAVVNLFGDLTVDGEDSIGAAVTHYAGFGEGAHATLNMTGGELLVGSDNIRGVFVINYDGQINLTDVSGGSV
ncbi:hypothetical protein LJC40_04395, partial [Synergistaceae bacterium OttesenSCG-928-D05]|nr:hypothetical protein [Synergistaceae bacterium OttesenSCG-928-D05]